MLSRYDRASDTVSHCTINSCRTPICGLHGSAITTVEGVGSARRGLHPIQERLAQFHASQCGFCTPGMLMSMYSLLRSHPSPSRQQVQTAVEGNLCRCTGYRSILASFNTFAQNDTPCGLGEKCCKLKVTSEGEATSQSFRDISNGESDYRPYDASQDAIFPSELKLSNTYDDENLTFTRDAVSWHRPVTLAQLLAIRQAHPTAKLIGGGNDINVTGGRWPVLVSVSRVPELCVVERTEAGLKLGAALSLAQMLQKLTDIIPRLSTWQAAPLTCFVTALSELPGQQLLNSATIGGHIMAASGASSINPLFLVARTSASVLAPDGAEREEMMDESFFVSHGLTKVSGDILAAIMLPFGKQNEYFETFRVHKQVSHSEELVNVSAAMMVSFDGDSDIIADMTLAFGGIRPKTIVASNTRKGSLRRRWEQSLIGSTARLLTDELQPPLGPPGGADAYRQTLAVSFFFKFFTSVRSKLDSLLPSGGATVTQPSDQSAMTKWSRTDVKASQVYEEVVESQAATDLVGRPIALRQGQGNATGETIFLSDVQPRNGELFLALVLSREAHANILSVDTSEALKVTGVVDYIDARDIPGENKLTSFDSEQVFYSDKVSCRGQTIGAIVAETHNAALKAAAAVKVKYETLKPILTIEEAIAAESWLIPVQELRSGSVSGGWLAAPHVVCGEVEMGGQEHFYMEPMACVAAPGAEGTLEVTVASHGTYFTQMPIAKVMGLPANKVIVNMKNVGGSFGGKATRSQLIILPACIAACKLGRPVRCVLERSTDMAITGGRHPFLAKYKVGFTPEGRIVVLEIDLYSNGGCTLDFTEMVMLVALMSFDNGTRVENLCVRGHCCRTNLPSNTAFRGFGMPQAAFFMQCCLQHIAEYLRLPPHQVTRLNLYEAGDTTPLNQMLSECTLARCWQQLSDWSEFDKRMEDVALFNRENRWKKRGLAILPTKFGICNGTLTAMCQGSALVNVYTDGTVLVAHSGVEMGQGINTKMMQVACRCLEISAMKVRISESNTTSIPNESVTGGSTTSDLAGGAVKDACEELMQRLASYKAAAPDGKWEDWVMAAYMNRVSLSATGFYKTPDITYNLKDNTGQSFLYFSAGVGCSEVEIDCLTGDHMVLRTDIVMDVGRSLNPAIDIGQIEGAFMQGYGLFATEEVKWSATGRLCNTGPASYRLPRFSDLPAQFNVSLLKGASNPHAIYSSKGIGEPPFFLAASIFFAIKNAIISAREDVGITGPFRLDSPCTPQRIRMACVDDFTKMSA